VAASEPLLANPVAMAFDANGRLFVVESRDGSGNGPGRIRLLEDSQGSGVFDVSTLYADDLNQPSAVICYGGGVFVAAGSEILFLKDSKGNGVADVRRVVFTSFSDANNKLTSSAAFTGFAWSLDNRIHVGTGSHGGGVISSSEPKASIILGAGNFSFDPRTFRLDAESGLAPAGMCFDDRGRKFVTGGGSAISLVMARSPFASRNPPAATPDTLLDLSDAGPASVIFPLWPDGFARPPVPLSRATSVGIYRGNTFGGVYAGDAFITDPGAGVIHRVKLRPNGLELIAERPFDEPSAEFLAGDASFRPVQVINGPDGTLYAAGLARAAAGSLTTAGKAAVPAVLPDYGRIYHIVPDALKSSRPPQFTKAGTAELVAVLRQPNGWWRDTAARLLYERQDKTAIAPLIQMLFDSRSPPLARMHALHALDGLNALVEPHILRGLADPDDRVREHAVLLAQRFVPGDGVVSAALWQRLAPLAGDPSAQVRYQLAFTLGQLRNPGRVAALAAIFRNDPADRWIQSAVLGSLNPGAAEMFGLLATDDSFRASAAGTDFLQQLLPMAVEQTQAGGLAPVLRGLNALPDLLAFRLVRALDDALQLAGTSVRAADPKGILNPLYQRAVNYVNNVDPNGPPPLDAILMQGSASYDQVGDSLFMLLNLPQTDLFQTAVVSTLGRFAEVNIAQGLVQRYGLLKAGARAEALVVLLARPERTAVLLSAFENRVLDPGDLSSPQIRFLLAHPDGAIRQRAAALLAQPDSARGRQAVARFQPALGLAGDAVSGRNVYVARCAACHELSGTGAAPDSLAVDLSPAARRSRAELLAAILAPKPEASSDRPAQLIRTSDGETLTGFIVAQSAASLTLGQTSGTIRTVPRRDVASQETLGGSVMPDGLGTGLDMQPIADLLAYLAGAVQPQP
jgi:putative membrane-bound dehydrogenase-like protein